MNTAKPLRRISAEEWTRKVRGNLAEVRILFVSSKVSRIPRGWQLQAAIPQMAFDATNLLPV
jgi:hypothetical protein